jgi:predicted DsbA family dithiol-disulfide isomerase
VQKQFEGQVTIIGVAGRDEPSAMAAFVEDLAVGNFSHVADEDLQIWMQYDIRSQPSYVFIDNDGSFETVIGAMGESGLSSKIAELLAA